MHTTRRAARTQIDHFGWAAPLGDAKRTTFQQRYFTNDAWWDRGAGPVFFYFGNEDDVELCALATPDSHRQQHSRATLDRHTATH